MLNARTWHRFYISGFLIFPGTLIFMFLPAGSPLLWLVYSMILWGIVVGLLGAIGGILLKLGKLDMGCPQCNSRCHVTGMDGNGAYLNCPTCGDLRINFINNFSLKIHRSETKLQKSVTGKSQHNSHSILLTPNNHPWPFLLLVFPVLISLAIVHPFFLLFPGFWCYVVGCGTIESIARGEITDNTGTAFRSKTPIRFWFKNAIWSTGYIIMGLGLLFKLIHEHELSRFRSIQYHYPGLLTAGIIMIVLMVIVVFGLISWSLIKLVRHLWWQKATAAWWVTLTCLMAGVLILGIWCTFRYEYQIGARYRLLGIPIPIVVFHLEDGQWVDFVLPPFQACFAFMVNINIMAGLTTLPIWLALRKSKT